jgi:hypothetical protein
MHVSSQNVRIISAVIIAGAMIGASFWFTMYETKLASALSTDELLRAYVEQDSDQDGLPDWQEEVYGTDPANPRSVDASMTDKDAVAEGLVAPAFISEEAPDPVKKIDIPGEEPSPNSLTKRFSEQFIQAYLSAGGGKNVTQEEQQQIISTLLKTFTQEVVETISSSYTRVSVRSNSKISLEAYSADLWSIFTKNDVPAEFGNPLALGQELINGAGETVLPDLTRLEKTYSSIADDLLETAVPPSAVEIHLSLLRNFDSFARAVNTLSTYEQDPIAALGALSIFETNSDSVVESFQSLAILILAEGEPEPGTASAWVVSFVRSIEQP